MKKFLFIILSIFLVNSFLNYVVKADEATLSQILVIDGQISVPNFALIQQKIKVLDDKLNLTEEQQQKANIIAVSSIKTVNSTMFKLININEKKRTIELKKGTSINNQMDNKKDFTRIVRSKLAVIRTKNMDDFEAILDTNQKIEFNIFKAEFKKLTEKGMPVQRTLQE